MGLEMSQRENEIYLFKTAQWGTLAHSKCQITWRLLCWLLLLCAQLLSHVWLCGHMDYSPPGSSVGGIFHPSPQSGVTFPQLLPHIGQWSPFSETILSWEERPRLSHAHFPEWKQPNPTATWHVNDHSLTRQHSEWLSKLQNSMPAQLRLCCSPILLSAQSCFLPFPSRSTYWERSPNNFL